MENMRKNMVSIMEEYLVSSVLFANYLESSGKVNHLDNCDFKYVRLLLASFQLTLWKEKFVTKDENKKVSGNLILDLSNDFINMIATLKEGKWVIGDIGFSDSYELIDVIRNKLAHGDFIVRDKDIEIVVNGLTGKININDLICFTSGLSSFFENMKITGTNIRPIGINTVNVNASYRRVKSNQQLKYIIDNFYYLEFSDYPLLPFSRDERYNTLINRSYKLITDEILGYVKKVGKLPDIDKMMERYNAVLKPSGIHIGCKITKSSDIKGKEIVFDIYNQNKKEFETYPLEEQIKFVNKILIYLANEEERKLNIQVGLICNSGLADILEKETNIDLEEAIKKFNLKALPGNVDMTVISIYIAMFYASYIYGLERVYKNEIRDHLEDLNNGFLFDFSKLDLSSFNPNVIDLSNDYTGFKDQLTSIESDYIKAQDKLTRAQENYDKYIQNSRNKSINDIKDVLLILSSKVREAKDKVTDVESLYLNSKDFMDNRFDDYKRNRAIIEHLRNSIAHGNVYLHRYNGDGSVDDSLLELKDIYEGELKFELRIRVREFITLFNSHNLSLLLDYIDNNLKEYEEQSKVLKLD